jgi:Flp pilus assembly protein CpaB
MVPTAPSVRGADMSAPGSSAAGDAGPAGRSRRRPQLPGRRPLPSSRALVGGLLVAVAMLATFALATHHGGGPTQRALVARHRIALGQRLTGADLEVVRVELPDATRAGTFASMSAAVGRVTLSPLAPGDLVERSGLAPTDVAPGQHELSIPIDRERALDGDLVPGELVDLLATYGTGDGARTVVVARRVRLVDVDDSHGSLDSAGKLVITIALNNRDDVLPTTHASQVGALTLVQTTGAANDAGSDGPSSYSVPTVAVSGDAPANPSGD